MEKKKLSLGIDLDAQLKKAIAKTIAPWKDLPVRWHAPESYHIPLLTLGWVEEDAITGLVDDLTQQAAQSMSCDVTFEKITPYFHKKNTTVPQYIRLVGKESVALRDLYVDFMDALAIGHGAIGHFTPYVSLGHVRAQAWKEQKIDMDVTQDFHVLVDVMSVTLFEETSVDGKRLLYPREVFALQ